MAYIKAGEICVLRNFIAVVSEKCSNKEVKAHLKYIDELICEIETRHTARNKLAWDYIKTRRETDKDYCRKKHNEETF